MSAHTPGPWAVSAEESSIVEDSRGVMVAEVYDGGDFDDEYDPRLEQANAHLIAACPTMLDYIKRQADAGDQEALSIWKGATNAS